MENPDPSRADTDAARERLAILLAHHADAVAAAAVMPRLAALLEGDDAEVRASAVRDRDDPLSNRPRRPFGPRRRSASRAVRAAGTRGARLPSRGARLLGAGGRARRVLDAGDLQERDHCGAAHADWRDALVEVFLVKVERGALPLYADTELTHWFSPSRLVHKFEDTAAEQGMATPGDADATRRELAAEAAALRHCDDVLRGDFTRFDHART